MKKNRQIAPNTTTTNRREREKQKQNPKNNNKTKTKHPEQIQPFNQAGQVFKYPSRPV